MAGDVLGAGRAGVLCQGGQHGIVEADTGVEVQHPVLEGLVAVASFAVVIGQRFIQLNGGKRRL